MDNLIIQIRTRSRDPHGRIPLRSRYSDRNFVTLQDGIEDRSAEIPRLGIITPPALTVSGLCASGLTVWYSDFECLTPYGVKCMIPTGRIGLCPSGLTNRIDVIAVDPLVQYDADGEIRYSGEVLALTGLEAVDIQEPYVPHIPRSWLKIGEAHLPAGSCICTLRSYIPDKVPTPMAAPRMGLTESMKLYVNPFRGHIGCSNQRVDYEGGFSPAFNPPGISGMHRLDLLVMTAEAKLEIISGKETVSPNRPVAPDYPAAKMPIAEVYLQDTDDYMFQDMISDVRPHFVWPINQRFTETDWIPVGNFCCKSEGAPDKADIIGVHPVMYFDDSQEESVFYPWRIPHRWTGDSGITAIISWVPTLGVACSDAVKWGIEYGAADLCAGITPGILVPNVGESITTLCCDEEGDPISWARRDTCIGLSASALTPGAIVGLRVYRDTIDPKDTLVGDVGFMGMAMEWEGYECVDRRVLCSQ